MRLVGVTRSSKAVAVPISARVATTDSTRDDDDDDNDAHKVAALLGREVPQDARVAVRRDEKPDLALGQRAVVAQHALGRREPTPDARTRLSVFSLCVGTSHSLANRQRGKKSRTDATRAPLHLGVGTKGSLANHQTQTKNVSRRPRPT